MDKEDHVFRSSLVRALLGAALIVTLTGPVAAQDATATPEGTSWRLVAYAAEGTTTEVPWYLGPRLTLEGGQAVGVAGCNELYATYQLEGDAISFVEPSTTDVGCAGEALTMETAYLAALPTSARWAIVSDADGGRSLTFSDADGAVALEFRDTIPNPSADDLRSLGNQVVSQQWQIDVLGRQVSKLRDRIKELEAASE
jgi:heat shock protein HslJ